MGTHCSPSTELTVQPGGQPHCLALSSSCAVAVQNKGCKREQEFFCVPSEQEAAHEADEGGHEGTHSSAWEVKPAGQPHSAARGSSKPPMQSKGWLREHLPGRVPSWQIPSSSETGMHCVKSIGLTFQLAGQPHWEAREASSAASEQ